MYLLKVDFLFTEDRCIQICSCINVSWANLSMKYMIKYAYAGMWVTCEKTDKIKSDKALR